MGAALTERVGDEGDGRDDEPTFEGEVRDREGHSVAKVHVPVVDRKMQLAVEGIAADRVRLGINVPPGAPVLVRRSSPPTVVSGVRGEMNTLAMRQGGANSEDSTLKRRSIAQHTGESAQHANRGGRDSDFEITTVEVKEMGDEARRQLVERALQPFLQKAWTALQGVLGVLLQSHSIEEFRFGSRQELERVVLDRFCRWWYYRHNKEAADPISVPDLPAEQMSEKLRKALENWRVQA